MKRLLFAFLLFAFQSVAQPVKVLYLPPGSTGFWGQTVVPLPGVAKQLDIDLTIDPRKAKRNDYIERVQYILETQGQKYDWVIWTQRKADPSIIFALFEKHGIKNIDITSGFMNFDLRTIKSPRLKYPNWKAQVLSNEFETGFFIGEQLTKYRKDKYHNTNVKAIALAGDRLSQAAMLSVSGLEHYYSSHSNNRLLQIVYANWQQTQAKYMTSRLLERHPQIDTIWSANANIALGITDQLREIDFSSYPKPIVATFGWNDEIFKRIKNDEIAFSMGGNHLTATLALLLIYDFEHGKSITTSQSNTFTIPYVQATKANLDKIKPTLTSEYWFSADIKQFSKVHQPNIKEHSFDLSILLE